MIGRIFIASIIWCYALGVATTYGGIWNAHANPQKNVEIVLNSNQRIKGDLTRNWDNAWVLTTSDGAEIHFFDFKKMSFKPTQERFTGSWRVILLQLLVTWIFVAFCFLELFRRNTHIASLLLNCSEMTEPTRVA